jgi:hypothetical protein
MDIKVWIQWYGRYGLKSTAKYIVANRVERIKQWACGKIGHGERLWTFDEESYELEYYCDRCKKILYC